jgi:hypothetical protein
MKVSSNRAFFLVLLSPVVLLTAKSATSQNPSPFDVAPFALPNTPVNEVWFEEPRDIVRIEVDFSETAPDGTGVSYRRHYWPGTKVEERAKGDPMPFGWIHQDDLFNGDWQEAAVDVENVRTNTVAITFQPLTAEFPDEQGYDVSFRRSAAVRINVPQPDSIRHIRVYTASRPISSTLRARLDAGGKTPASLLKLSGYNAIISQIQTGAGMRLTSEGIGLESADSRMFTFDVDRMRSAHDYCWDDAHITLGLDNDAFTISLTSLDAQGPIWSPDYCVYITRADDPTTFEQYLERNAGAQTINARVSQRAEQRYANAYRGQPRPHDVPYFVGVALARQRFRVEPHGEVWVYPRNLEWIPGRDSDRTHMAGITHFRFGLEDWMTLSRYTDPEPANIVNLSVRRGGLILEQKVFAIPLLTTLMGGTWASDDPMVAIARFTVRNDGPESTRAEIPLTIDQHNNEHVRVAANPLRVESQGGPCTSCMVRKGTMQNRPTCAARSSQAWRFRRRGAGSH